MAAKRGHDYWLGLLRQHAKSGQSLADFCKRKKVSYKTARNWRSKLGDDAIQGNVPGQPEQGQGHETGQGQAEEGEKAEAPGDSEKSESQPVSREASSPDGGEKRADDGGDNPARKPHPGWANLIPAQPGNQLARKHGGYSKYLPPDVQQELDTYGRDDLLSVLEEIRLAKGRLIMVTRSRSEWDAKQEYDELADSDYQLDEIGDKVSADGRERTTKRSRPKFEELEDQLSRRLAWLQQVHDQLSRRVSLTADEAMVKRREIMERAEDEGWSAADIGKEIEKLGLEVPFTIQQLIRAELALIEAPEPEGGVTDDELEALSTEYQNKMEGEPDWLAERREEVKAIHTEKDKERVGE